MLNKQNKIYIAGHRGMVGSAIERALTKQNFNQIVTQSHKELDLTNQADVTHFLAEEKPDYVVLAAAKVGGIHANNAYPAEFIYENLMIQSNVIHAAFLAGVKSLLFLGSSCIYPKLANQPMAEDELLTGPLEATNEPYAIAKIAGIKLCESYNRQYNTDYRSVMPTNLYGVNDNFHPENSHVLPALMRKFHEAKIQHQPTVEVWGTGNARREFLHVDDMASACLHIMQLDKTELDKQTNDMLSHINVGSGAEVSILELAELIAQVIEYEGVIQFDKSKPDGTPRKLMNNNRISALGWQPNIHLKEGIQSTYEWFLDHQHDYRQSS